MCRHGSEAHPRTMMLHPTFGQSIHQQRKVTFEKVGEPAPLAETGEADQTLIRMLDRMLAGRTGLSPVMVGRTSPLSRLTGLMTSSDREPAVALVVGEAGVGKTRLLRELVASLHLQRPGARRPGRARIARPSVRARARRSRPRRRPGGRPTASPPSCRRTSIASATVPPSSSSRTCTGPMPRASGCSSGSRPVHRPARCSSGRIGRTS